MKYIKDFIVQVNSKEESEELGGFLRTNNITTKGFSMNASSIQSAYIIENNKVSSNPYNWGGKYNYRLFQNLDELKKYFQNSEAINENNYEIY